MYKSPIEILTDDIHAQIVKLEEDQILKAVVNVGIKVDKKELLRALRYDRQQYAVGYIEGKADAAPKWIPVTERLPSEKKVIDGETYFKNVAVRVKDLAFEKIAFYDDEEKCWFDTEFFPIAGDVTHWMPLPEPPKGE